MTAALSAEGLHTFYGKSHILYDVSLAVAEGSITTLLGRNGAGKTTTMRSIMGLTPARSTSRASTRSSRGSSSAGRTAAASSRAASRRCSRSAAR